MKLLLDTCAFLWLTNRPGKISKPAASAINDGKNELFLSEASIWEMVLKHRTGKLPLPGEPRVWIPGQRAAFHLGSVRITTEEIFLSGELPPIHADPFDRLLAAQALIGPFTLITPDPPFQAYGVNCIW